MTVPSGVLVLVDAGLLGIWEGSREDLPDTVDFRVEGPDAKEAGEAFDRSWQPLYWYDIPRDKAQEARDQFEAFAESNDFHAQLAEVSGGVPHRQRISFALEHGGGRFGTLEFFGIQTPVIAGIPGNGSIPVYGFRMAEEEFPDRWRWVTLEIEDGNTARTEEITTVFVDEARLMFADADALQEWKHEEPLDGTRTTSSGAAMQSRPPRCTALPSSVPANMAG